MSKPSAPKPADPQETAGAQTANNVATAITQQALNNTNQVTPNGSLTYTQSGTHEFTDPNTGRTYDIPTYTAETTLSPDQQAILDQSNKAGLSFATLAADQSGRLKDHLSKPIDASGLPAAGNADDIRNVNLARVGNGPDLTTTIAGAGDITRKIAGAGDITRTIADAGDITRNIADAGDITKTYGTDFSQDRQRVEDALMERLNPGLDADRKTLEARLASQGIRIGSEAYSSAMDDYSRHTNDARIAAILNAGTEQSRLVGMEADRARFENEAQGQQFDQNAASAGFTNAAQKQQFEQNAAGAEFSNKAQQQKFDQNRTSAEFANDAQKQQFDENVTRAAFGNDAKQQAYQNRVGAAGFNNAATLSEANADTTRFNAENTAHQSALSELLALRDQPINEITALLSGSQKQSPSFVNTTPAQIPTTDFAGIQATHDNQAAQSYAQQLSNWNSLWGGMLGLGGSAIMASDRRVKTAIKRVGKTDDGQPIYRFRYKSGGPIQMGLMAQDVEKKKPGAVVDVGGIKMVDYGKALA